MRIIGDKNRFAFEIGEYLENSRDLRRVDIWAGGIRLCTYDDMVYVGSYIGSLEHNIQRSYDVNLFKDLLAGKSPEEMAWFVASTYDEDHANFGLEDKLFPSYRFLDLGETTDNFSAFLFRDGSKAVLTYSLWMDAKQNKVPEVFQPVSLDFEAIIQILKETVEILRTEMNGHLLLYEGKSGSVHIEPSEDYFGLLEKLAPSISERTQRQITCAFARLVWDDLPEIGREGLLLAERFLDTEEGRMVRKQYREEIVDLLPQRTPSPLETVFWALDESIESCLAWANAFYAGRELVKLKVATGKELCSIIRKIVAEERQSHEGRTE